MIRFSFVCVEEKKAMKFRHHDQARLESLVTNVCVGVFISSFYMYEEIEPEKKERTKINKSTS